MPYEAFNESLANQDTFIRSCGVQRKSKPVGRPKKTEEDELHRGDNLCIK